MRVLLIEDDADVRTTLADILELEGFQVAWCEDGAAAIERLRQGERPDVILLDLMMPQMDGWQFRATQEADPALAQIPVVVLSAQGGLTADQVQRLHASSFLRKPIEVGQLVDALSRSQPDELPAP
jgi:two-component system response regulator MprA